jgi:hypothetical protein
MGKTALIGLLAKAHELRGRLHDGVSDDSIFDSESGISREDQKEILKEIEKVATQSRISVSPEVFAVRAVKRGVLFPILTNFIMILVAGLGIAGLYLYFQRSESQISVEQPASFSVESDIIEQMKKDAAARLQEKNLEIDQIQGRLSEINKEKQDLQSSMDTKVSQRERELRAAMDAELEAERERLRKQGLSEEVISTRLGDLETRKNSEFTTQLAAFKKQADEERAKSEANLKNLETEFSASLAKANVEKEQAVAEAAQREEALRKQTEQKTQAAETAKTKAELALLSLSEQKQKEDFASDQLIGLYETVKTDIRERNYEKALTSLQVVSGFVRSEEIAALPGIAKRRAFDLFVIESLGALVKSEVENVSTDTSTLVAATNQISEIRALVRDADAHLKAGRVEEAEKAYAKALEVMPEVSKSYAYLIQKEKSADTVRQARLREGLTKAETSLAAGKPAESLGLYRATLINLPETAERVERMLSNIQSIGLEQGLEKTKSEQSRAASSFIARADSLNADGEYDDAIPLYLQTLTRYPLSGSEEQISRGIQNAVRGIVNRSSGSRRESETALNSEIASLKQQIASRQSDISRIKRYITELIGRGDPDAMEVNAVLESLRSSYAGLARDKTSSEAKLADSLAKTEAENARLLTQIDGLKSDLVKAGQAATSQQEQAQLLQQQLQQQQQTAAQAPLNQVDAQRLKTLADRFASMDKGYKSYTALEDPIVGAKGSEGLVDTKAYLDSFLGSKAVDETFPGLLARIKRYDQGFQAVGRSDALQDVLDIAIGFSQTKTVEEKNRFFDKYLREYRNDAQMTGLVKKLQEILK